METQLPHFVIIAEGIWEIAEQIFMNPREKVIL